MLGDGDDPRADLVRFVPQLGLPILLIGGALSAAVFLVVISRAGQRSATIPAWFAILGYAAAVAMLGGVFFVPKILLPIWSIAAAFVLAR